MDVRRLFPLPLKLLKIFNLFHITQKPFFGYLLVPSLICIRLYFIPSALHFILLCLRYFIIVFYLAFVFLPPRICQFISFSISNRKKITPFFMSFNFMKRYWWIIFQKSHNILNKAFVLYWFIIRSYPSTLLPVFIPLCDTVNRVLRIWINSTFICICQLTGR